MGKGDKKTKRGKIVMGSHGVRRLRKRVTRISLTAAPKAKKPVVAAKEKAPAKPKAVKEETKSEVPESEVPVVKEEKPAKKKAPAKTSSKASAKKQEKSEE